MQTIFSNLKQLHSFLTFFCVCFYYKKSYYYTLIEVFFPSFNSEPWLYSKFRSFQFNEMKHNSDSSTEKKKLDSKDLDSINWQDTQQLYVFKLSLEACSPYGQSTLSPSQAQEITSGSAVKHSCYALYLAHAELSQPDSKKGTIFSIPLQDFFNRPK